MTGQQFAPLHDNVFDDGDHCHEAAEARASDAKKNPE
jgi:hypothetical protein